MSLDENAARNIIRELLNNDIHQYKKWLCQIEKFNAEEIEALLEGDENRHYPVTNPEKFKKLIYKFENYQNIIFQWYKKEECRGCLIELWKNYIKIEGIECINDDEKFSEYLKSHSINYSNWPEKIKKEFKMCCNNTTDSLIQRYKEHMDKIPEINEIINDLKGIKNDCIHLNKSLPVELQKKIEKNSDIITGAILTVFCFYWSKEIGISLEGKSIKVLAKQFLNDGICTNREEALTMAKQEIQCCKENNTSFVNINLGTEEYNDEIEYDLSELVDFKKTTKVLFRNNITCWAVAGLSLANLYWSVKEFREIHLNFEQKIAGLEKYRSRLAKINKNFENHTSELKILDDDDYALFINNIKKVRDNVLEDKKLLEQLIKDLQTEIKEASTKKNFEIAGLIGSVVLTAAGGVGTLVTKGFQSAVYGLSTLGNICCAGMHSINLTDYVSYIGELNKILKEAKDLNSKIIKYLDELILKLEQKKLEFPDFYKNAHEIRKIQNKKNSILKI